MVDTHTDTHTHTHRCRQRQYLRPKQDSGDKMLLLNQTFAFGAIILEYDQYHVCGWSGAKVYTTNGSRCIKMHILGCIQPLHSTIGRRSIAFVLVS